MSELLQVAFLEQRADIEFIPILDDLYLGQYLTFPKNL